MASVHASGRTAKEPIIMTTKANTNKGIVLFLACVAQFMVVLDIAIVNVALPSIQRDLHIGQSTLQWIVIAYGLMLGGFLLLGGRMADLLGRRRVLLAGLALFSAASLLAGAVTVTGGLLLLVYAVNRSADYGWSSGSTLGLLAASVVMLSAFARIEARSRSPLVPGAAVRNRTLVAANLSAFFLFGAFFAFIFLGSLLMQQVLGYSPTLTRETWLATTVMSFFAAGIAGAKLVGVVGVRRLLVG